MYGPSTCLGGYDVELQLTVFRGGKTAVLVAQRESHAFAKPRGSIYTIIMELDAKRPCISWGFGAFKEPKP